MELGRLKIGRENLARPLHLDPTRVALLSAANSTSVDSLRTTPQQHGLPIGDVHPLAVHGWSMVTLAAQPGADNQQID